MLRGLKSAYAGPSPPYIWLWRDIGRGMIGLDIVEYIIVCKAEESDFFKTLTK